MSQTFFASPSRDNPENIKKDYERLKDVAWLRDVFDAMPDVAVLMNGHRQIIYSNKILPGLLSVSDVHEILGERAGEAISCIHAPEGKCGSNLPRIKGQLFMLN